MKLLANKYALGAAGLLIALAAVWGYGHWQYGNGVSDTETAAKIAAFDQYKSEVAKINAASYDLQNRLTELSNEKPKIVVQYRDRMVQAPLPADCRIDDERLRNIAGAISAARSAGKYGVAVP